MNEMPMTMTFSKNISFEEMKETMKLMLSTEQFDDNNSVLIGNIHCMLQKSGNDLSVLYASWSVG
jgi:hypothetical protein